MQWGWSACRAAYAQFGEYEFLKNTHGLVLFVTVAAIITAVVQLVFYFNFFLEHVQRARRPATIPGRPRRWNGTFRRRRRMTNFAGIVPEVYRGPYEFAVPGAAKDYVMQSEPEGGPVGAH